MAVKDTNPATLDAARKEFGGNVLVVASDARDLAGQSALARNLIRPLSIPMRSPRPLWQRLMTHHLLP